MYFNTPIVDKWFSKSEAEGREANFLVSNEMFVYKDKVHWVWVS
jgi:hypothetical protein